MEISSCFNTVEVTKLDVNVPIRSNLLFIHCLISTLISLFGLTLNAVLLHIIMHKCQSAGKIKPMLMFSSVVDLVQSIATLFYSPVINASFGYFITFNNGFLSINSWHVNNVLCAFTVASVVCGWTCSPLQFLGRLHLLKHCKRPKGSHLSAYIFGTTVACLSVTALTFYFYSRINAKFILSSLIILKNAGFTASKFDVHGSNMGEHRLQVYLLLLTFTSITSNSIIIGCWVSKKHYLNEMTRQVKISVMTNRMQADLQKVFIALGICPLFTNCLPTAIHIFGINACQNYTILTLICSLTFLSGPIINPLTAMFFVRPYRRIIMYWLGLNRRQHKQNAPNKHDLRQLPVLSIAAVSPSLPRRLPTIRRALSEQPTVSSDFSKY